MYPSERFNEATKRALTLGAGGGGACPSQLHRDGALAYRAFAHRDTTVWRSGELRPVLFERASATTSNEGPGYVNPVAVARVDQVSKDQTSITLRHDPSSTLVVRGTTNAVVCRLAYP